MLPPELPTLRSDWHWESYGSGRFSSGGSQNDSDAAMRTLPRPSSAILPSEVRLSDFPAANIMTTLVRIHRKGQMTLPSRLRTAVGLAEGDLIEASVQRGKIVLTPKLVNDCAKFPRVDDEYTPAQRRIIDARLAKADEDIRRDRVYGPFNTAEEMAASVEAKIKALPAAKGKTNPVR